MEIRWPNVFATVLAVVAVTIWFRMNDAIWSALQAMGQIAPPDPADRERFWGVIAFGMICILILGVIRILSTRDDGK